MNRLRDELSIIGLTKLESDMARIRQHGTINMLIGRLLDGVFDLGKLIQPGDIGLGAFHGLDGEMIVLDGICYQARADGVVRVAETGARSPYVTLGTFEDPRAIDFQAIEGFASLSKRLDAELADTNRPALVRIEGRFPRLKARSVHPQAKPYSGLDGVAKSQAIFEWTDFEGTIVGVRFPEYLQVLQVAGWHLHAISTDAARGGHLLDLQVESAHVKLESAEGFEVCLPDDESFRKADLPVDVHAEVQRAERDANHLE